MDIPIIIIASSIVVSCYTAYKILSKRDEIKMYNELFRYINNQLGLAFVKGGMFRKPEIHGEYRGHKLSVYQYIIVRKYSKDYYVQIVFRYKPTISSSMKIINETTPSKFANALGFHDILTGDEIFDKRLFVKGSKPVQIFGILSKTARNNILKLENITNSFEIDNSIIQIKRYFTKDHKIYINIINLIVDICNEFNRRQFNNSAELKRALMENILQESDEKVQLFQIGKLINYYSMDEDILSFFKKLLDSSPNSVQFEASKYLGDEGLEHLTKMINRNNNIENGLMIEIIQFLAKNKFKKSLPALIKLSKSGSGVDVLCEIYKSFYYFADESLNDLLLEKLKSKNGDMKKYIVEALGTCGKINAVEPLFKLQEDSLNPFFRNSIKKSIEQIQERHGKGDKGWLSVSKLSEKEGGLSIDENAGEGGLSIDDE